MAEPMCMYSLRLGLRLVRRDDWWHGRMLSRRTLLSSSCAQDCRRPRGVSAFAVPLICADRYRVPARRKETGRNRPISGQNQRYREFESTPLRQRVSDLQFCHDLSKSLAKFNFSREATALILISALALDLRPRKSLSRSRNSCRRNRRPARSGFWFNHLA